MYTRKYIQTYSGEGKKDEEGERGGRVGGEREPHEGTSATLVHTYTHIYIYIYIYTYIHI